jgi:hypothetical protein
MFSFLLMSHRCEVGLRVTYKRGSLGLIIRLTAANFLVCFAFPYRFSRISGPIWAQDSPCCASIGRVQLVNTIILEISNGSVE